jgi:uncharacterized protein YqeY
MVVMSDEERQALLARLQASREEAMRMSPEEARERLANEERREMGQFAEGSSARA